MAPLLVPPPFPIPARALLKGAAGELGVGGAGLEDAVVDTNMVLDAGDKNVKNKEIFNILTLKMNDWVYTYH